MPTCHLEPADKKAFVGSVGEELVRRNGKRKYYQPAEIRKAADSQGYPINIHCWAYCIFSTPETLPRFKRPPEKFVTTPP